jgi:hypothetical protein
MVEFIRFNHRFDQQIGRRLVSHQLAVMLVMVMNVMVEWMNRTAERFLMMSHVTFNWRLLLRRCEWLVVVVVELSRSLLIMLLTKDERTDHTESGSLDQMSLADVTAEATSVE